MSLLGELSKYQKTYEWWDLTESSEVIAMIRDTKLRILERLDDRIQVIESELLEGMRAHEIEFVKKIVQEEIGE